MACIWRDNTVITFESNCTWMMANLLLNSIYRSQSLSSNGLRPGDWVLVGLSETGI